MKKIFLLTILVILIQSCNSQSKNNIEKENSSVSKPFDLANLILNEDIYDLLASVNLSEKDTIKSDKMTLMGNQRLVFNSEEVMLFNKTRLGNKNSLNKNTVTFHFGKIDQELGALNNEKHNIIGMYEINLSTKSESDALYSNLNILFGKPKNVYNLGPVTTFLWVNNNICYYYFTKDNDEFYRVLIVYKKTDKEWIDFIGHLGFDNGNLKLVK